MTFIIIKPSNTNSSINNTKINKNNNININSMIIRIKLLNFKNVLSYILYTS